MVGNNTNRYTQEQYARIEEIIIEYAQAGSRYIHWEDYAVELGHPRASLASVASKIHQRRRVEKARQHRILLRALADGVAEQAKPKPAAAPDIVAVPIANSLPSPAVYFRHRLTVPTSRLIFEAEIRGRIEVQGLTAGQFGDPPPGRSALDKKRMGIVS